MTLESILIGHYFFLIKKKSLIKQKEQFCFFVLCSMDVNFVCFSFIQSHAKGGKEKLVPDFIPKVDHFVQDFSINNCDLATLQCS